MPDLLEAIALLSHCNECEPLEACEQVQDTLAVASVRGTWMEFARWASRVLPGQWWPRADSCTWVCGRRACWFIERSLLDPTYDAVDCIKSLGLACGWSIGQAARSLLKYVGAPQASVRSDLALLDQTSRSYIDCAPGIYSRGVLADVKSCYFSLFTRLPSLRCYVPRPGRLTFARELADETKRRREVELLVVDRKLLRNAIVGCMTGKATAGQFWCGGERRILKLGQGPFRAAGLLVVRTGWELCREASCEVESVLSLVDCVISPDAELPDAWSKYGLTTRAITSGTAEIYNPSCYRIGDRKTHWYGRGSRLKEVHERPTCPDVRYTSLWLTQSA